MPDTALPDTDLPVRYCHGCRDYDDHPRFTHIADMHNGATDHLYHYDCVPADVLADHPEAQPGADACAAGKRGQDVRDVMIAHAAAIEEAPADQATDKETI